MNKSNTSPHKYPPFPLWAGLLMALFAGAACGGVNTGADAPRGFPAPPPLHNLTCYHPDGSSTATPIVNARAFNGGIMYVSGVGTSVTTSRCIAHLEPDADIGAKMSVISAPVHCEGATGALVYYGVANIGVLASGVWTWVEEGTGDVFVSTAECTALGLD